MVSKSCFLVARYDKKHSPQNRAFGSKARKTLEKISAQQLKSRANQRVMTTLYIHFFASTLGVKRKNMGVKYRLKVVRDACADAYDGAL